MSCKTSAGRLFSVAVAAASSLLVLSQFAPAVEAQDTTTTSTMDPAGSPTNNGIGTTATIRPPANPLGSSRGLANVTELACGGLECQHNSTCQEGNATYTLDTPVGFHTVTNQNGFHCACPPGFAGLDCTRPVEDCGVTGWNAQCFHGGTCLPQSEMEDVEYAAFCECSGAMHNEQRYAGKYCEVPVEENDYCPEQTGLFCLNGGTCPLGGARAEHR